MREGAGTGATGLKWLLGDHPSLHSGQVPSLHSGQVPSLRSGQALGSTSIAANADGSFYGSLRYKPWGEVRYANRTTPTTFRFTGQRQESSLGGAEGLYYYGARWYDPALGRFAQADTIIPEATQGTQAWDRYAYVNNSPVNRTDPTGHETVLCDEACENNNGSLAKKGKPVYGVTFVGSFTESEKAEIWAALLAISAKIGGAGVFNSVFEGLIFTRDTKLGGLGGQWNEDGTVHLNPALLTQYVVTHELGHVFHTKVYDIDYDNSPANQLVKAGNEIKDNRGNVVSGLDDGSYRRTDAGYQACPNRKGCRYEEHPTTIDIDADPPENPNNPGEDVADMFLNWVYDSFDYSDAAKGAGTARYEWWDSRMAGWIDTITR